VSGQDLLDVGFAPGENFRLALAYAHKLRLAGLSKEDQLRQTLGYLRSLSKEKTT
jgi:tRNA nucleotidyltransferase (CCA-adding enzyme)